MKKRLLMLLALMVALPSVWLTSCSDDDDDISASEVPQAVMTAFTSRYAAAKFVKWERDRGYYKADFFVEQNEVDAWFQPDGTWHRSETDLLPTQLPEAVQSYLAANYPDRYIDDCDLIETPSESYYLIELDKAGSPDTYVRLSATGQVMP